VDRLDGLPAAVHACLAAAASADEVARAVERPLSDVLAALLELELLGMVRSRGGCYERL
jgi:predicted Rossmann fold nucleotide-binding protein DprA/Smf involved in DNA uptake